jgi:hypothetical protein
MKYALERDQRMTRTTVTIICTRVASCLDQKCGALYKKWVKNAANAACGKKATLNLYPTTTADGYD